MLHPIGRVRRSLKRVQKIRQTARRYCAALVLFGLGAAACAPEEKVMAPADLVETKNSGVIAEALASSTRLAGDRADDAARMPANVLAFAGVAPGMKVFEMEAGAGYYTELLSLLVGPGGEVVMHNPESFDAFLGDVVTRRVDGRLGNVRLSKSNFDALDAEDGSVDIVTWFLGPHDLYYTPNGGGPLGDDDKAFAEIVRILKPGGLMVALDHAASAGAPNSTGGAVHRIDPAVVKALASDAGLTFVGESDILRNAGDDYAVNVFDVSVRRKTDRFLFKFKKETN